MPIVNTQDSIQVAYEVHGSDSTPDNRKTIIFAHGNGNCKADWSDPDVDYIQPLVLLGYRLLLVDSRGYGNSEKPHDPKYYTPEFVVSDYIAVMDAVLGSESRCHFYGNSRGLTIGLAAATHHADRFHSFMLAGGKPKQSDSTLEFPKLLANGIDAFVDGIKELFGYDFPAGLEKRFRENDVKAMIAANSIQWPDYHAILSEINVPCLLN